MVGVFLSFGALAHTAVIKEFGIGLTIAVAVDASLVRIPLVPAVMRVLGHAAWWAPKPLARVYQRLGMGGAGDPEGLAASQGASRPSVQCEDRRDDRGR